MNSQAHADHADAEFHHHHSHAAGSHHPGHHHLLSVEDLTVAFDMYDPAAPFFRAGRVRQEVLHGLTLSVHEGEVLAVVGASGSGKTVLADALLGLYEANAEVSGRIWFDGEPQDAASLAALRGGKIAFVPQGVNALDPLMRVGEQVCGVPRGSTRAERAADRLRRRARQEELFSAYGLAGEVARMYPHELSGGMARRVLLMCALMENPRLIIADEPTPGMDLERAVRAMDDLRAFANMGGGVLLITHDLELALRVADRVAVFRDGAIVEETSAASFADPEQLRHPFTRSLAHELHALRCVKEGQTHFYTSGDVSRHVVLRAKGVSLGYGERLLLAGLDFTVRAGERVALLGPSGVGKTTLCKVLTGQLEPRAGRVEVQGCAGSAFPDDPADEAAGASERKSSAPGPHANPVQLISQHPEQAFDPRMRMGRSLAEAGPLDTLRAVMLRERFGIRGEWLSRLPHELSGGELMRFALVRALMTRPQVLICDESTAMLDLVTQAELWRHIIDLQQEDGFALIFVSHNPQLVRRMTNRSVNLVQDGQIGL